MSLALLPRDYAQLRYLEAVVGPGAHLELADLVVEGEEGDVDLARAVELDDGRPEHVPVVLHHRERLHVAVRVVLGAGTNTKNIY